MDQIALFQKQLAMTRTAAMSLVQSVDLLMELWPVKPEETPPPVPVPPLSVDPETCDHPKDRRMPTPSMGHLTRAMCQVCGLELE